MTCSNPLLLIILASLFLTGCNRAPSTEPLLIGHVAPLVGRGRLSAITPGGAMRLAVEEINKEENRIDLPRSSRSFRV